MAEDSIDLIQPPSSSNLQQIMEETFIELQYEAVNPEAGNLKKLIIENFEHISLLTIEFQKISQFVGIEGDGRRSIQRSIYTALGFEPPSSLKDFIRAGTVESRLELVLHNTGERSFEQSKYGDEITIRRRFSDSKTSLELRSQNGNVISVSEEDLANIRSYFGLRSHLVAKINKDSIRTLNSFTPAEKYSIFKQTISIHETSRPEKISNPAVEKLELKIEELAWKKCILERTHKHLLEKEVLAVEVVMLARQQRNSSAEAQCQKTVEEIALEVNEVETNLLANLKLEQETRMAILMLPSGSGCVDSSLGVKEDSITKLIDDKTKLLIETFQSILAVRKLTGYLFVDHTNKEILITTLSPNECAVSDTQADRKEEIRSYFNFAFLLALWKISDPPILSISDLDYLMDLKEVSAKTLLELKPVMESILEIASSKPTCQLVMFLPSGAPQIKPSTGVSLISLGSPDPKSSELNKDAESQPVSGETVKCSSNNHGKEDLDTNESEAMLSAIKSPSVGTLNEEKEPVNEIRSSSCDAGFEETGNMNGTDVTVLSVVKSLSVELQDQGIEPSNSKICSSDESAIEEKDSDSSQPVSKTDATVLSVASCSFVRLSNQESEICSSSGDTSSEEKNSGTTRSEPRNDAIVSSASECSFVGFSDQESETTNNELCSDNNDTSSEEKNSGTNESQQKADAIIPSGLEYSSGLLDQESGTANSEIRSASSDVSFKEKDLDANKSEAKTDTIALSVASCSSVESSNQESETANNEFCSSGSDTGFEEKDSDTNDSEPTNVICSSDEFSNQESEPAKDECSSDSDPDFKSKTATDITASAIVNSSSVELNQESDLPNSKLFSSGTSLESEPTNNDISSNGTGLESQPISNAIALSIPKAPAVGLVNLHNLKLNDEELFDEIFNKLYVDYYGGRNNDRFDGEESSCDEQEEDCPGRVVPFCETEMMTLAESSQIDRGESSHDEQEDLMGTLMQFCEAEMITSAALSQMNKSTLIDTDVNNDSLKEIALKPCSKKKETEDNFNADTSVVSLSSSEEYLIDSSNTSCASSSSWVPSDKDRKKLKSKSFRNVTSVSKSTKNQGSKSSKGSKKGKSSKILKDSIENGNKRKSLSKLIPKSFRNVTSVSNSTKNQGSKSSKESTKGKSSKILKDSIKKGNKNKSLKKLKSESFRNVTSVSKSTENQGSKSSKGSTKGKSSKILIDSIKKSNTKLSKNNRGRPKKSKNNRGRPKKNSLPKNSSSELKNKASGKSEISNSSDKSKIKASEKSKIRSSLDKSKNKSSRSSRVSKKSDSHSSMKKSGDSVKNDKSKSSPFSSPDKSPAKTHRRMSVTPHRRVENKNEPGKKTDSVKLSENELMKGNMLNSGLMFSKTPKIILERCCSVKQFVGASRKALDPESSNLSGQEDSSLSPGKPENTLKEHEKEGGQSHEVQNQQSGKSDLCNKSQAEIKVKEQSVAKATDTISHASTSTTPENEKLVIDLVRSETEEPNSLDRKVTNRKRRDGSNREDFGSEKKKQRVNKEETSAVPNFEICEKTDLSKSASSLNTTRAVKHSFSPLIKADVHDKTKQPLIKADVHDKTKHENQDSRSTAFQSKEQEVSLPAEVIELSDDEPREPSPDPVDVAMQRIPNSDKLVVAEQSVSLIPVNSMTKHIVTILKDKITSSLAYPSSQSSSQEPMKLDPKCLPMQLITEKITEPDSQNSVMKQMKMPLPELDVTESIRQETIELDPKRGSTQLNKEGLKKSDLEKPIESNPESVSTQMDIEETSRPYPSDCLIHLNCEETTNQGLQIVVNSGEISEQNSLVFVTETSEEPNSRGLFQLNGEKTMNLDQGVPTEVSTKEILEANSSVCATVTSKDSDLKSLPTQSSNKKGTKMSVPRRLSINRAAKSAGLEKTVPDPKANCSVCATVTSKDSDLKGLPTQSSNKKGTKMSVPRRLSIRRAAKSAGLEITVPDPSVLIIESTSEEPIKLELKIKSPLNYEELAKPGPSGLATRASRQKSKKWSNQGKVTPDSSGHVTRLSRKSLMETNLIGESTRMKGKKSISNISSRKNSTTTNNNEAKTIPNVSSPTRSSRKSVMKTTLTGESALRNDEEKPTSDVSSPSRLSRKSPMKANLTSGSTELTDKEILKPDSSPVRPSRRRKSTKQYARIACEEATLSSQHEAEFGEEPRNALALSTVMTLELPQQETATQLNEDIASSLKSLVMNVSDFDQEFSTAVQQNDCAVLVNDIDNDDGSAKKALTTYIIDPALENLLLESGCLASPQSSGENSIPEDSNSSAQDAVFSLALSPESNVIETPTSQKSTRKRRSAKSGSENARSKESKSRTRGAKFNTLDQSQTPTIDSIKTDASHHKSTNKRKSAPSSGKNLRSRDSKSNQDPDFSLSVSPESSPAKILVTRQKLPNSSGKDITPVKRKRSQGSGENPPPRKLRTRSS